MIFLMKFFKNGNVCLSNMTKGKNFVLFSNSKLFKKWEIVKKSVKSCFF